MEVPSDVLPKLVCKNCDGYLSRGPVHLMDSVGYRCGRCLQSEEEQGTRIEAYEELAKLMTFPCRYQHNGCTTKVPFAENEAHEEACPYRKYICPIAELGQCEWMGIQTELLEHCRQDHPDNVVDNPCKFMHNITRSSLHNYLLWTLGVLFLIQTKVCTATRKIYHSVRLISDPARASNYKYTLCIQNKDSRFYKDRQVAPRGCLALQNDSSIQADINNLLGMLEDFRGTTFTVTVELAGHGTMEALRAESSSPGTSSANEPVYREGWLCMLQAPKKSWCICCGQYNLINKYATHESCVCKRRWLCELCCAYNEKQNAHYTQTHADVIHRAGTVCTVSPTNTEHEFWIIGYDFGRVVCTYKLLNDTYAKNFVLYVYTALLSSQLYMYKCTVDISHPDTGHTLKCVPTVGYHTEYDWSVEISRDNFDKYSQNNKVNIKINITEIKDSSEFNL